MWCVGIGGESRQVFRVAPVTDEHGGAAQPRVVAEQSGGGILLEVAEHPRHRARGGKPGANGKGIVDAHSDEEDRDGVAVGFDRGAAVDDGLHVVFPSVRFGAEHMA
jgi:hypothetical protein